MECNHYIDLHYEAGTWTTRRNKWMDLVFENIVTVKKWNLAGVQSGLCYSTEISIEM